MVTSLQERRGSPLLIAFRMAPRKRKSIGQVNWNCKRTKLLRAAENTQQRQARLEHNRTRNAEFRVAETPQQRQACLELFFLDAPGGTGKTFLINLLLAENRKQHEIALVLA
jgi:hypothetical protein